MAKTAQSHRVRRSPVFRCPEVFNLRFCAALARPRELAWAPRPDLDLRLDPGLASFPTNARFPSGVPPGRPRRGERASRSPATCDGFSVSPCSCGPTVPSAEAGGVVVIRLGSWAFGRNAVAQRGLLSRPIAGTWYPRSPGMFASVPQGRGRLPALSTPIFPSS